MCILFKSFQQSICTSIYTVVILFYECRRLVITSPMKVLDVKKNICVFSISDTLITIDENYHKVEYSRIPLLTVCVLSFPGKRY